MIQMLFWKWDDCYLTNVAMLDEHHRQLITMVNVLYANVLECEDMQEEKELTRQLIQELIAYGRAHFGAEEEIMQQYGYPGYLEHKEAHEKFWAQITELVGQYERGEVALSFPVFVFIKGWIEEHVLNIDRLYGPYLNEKGVV